MLPGSTADVNKNRNPKCIKLGRTWRDRGKDTNSPQDSLDCGGTEDRDLTGKRILDDKRVI